MFLSGVYATLNLKGIDPFFGFNNGSLVQKKKSGSNFVCTKKRWGC